MLEIRNLSAGYTGRAVIHDLNLTVHAGEILAVVGPNGCGKSTLLKSVIGMTERTAGEVYTDGQAASTLSPRRLAQKVAYLPQNRQTPEITALELVLHGRFPHLSYPRRYGKRDMEIACAAMETMGVSEYAERPLGELSGGMRQKVYIAMALAQDALVILMDEPTTFLDMAHQLKTMEHARFLAGSGKTVVMVLHDIDMAMRTADRVAVMRGGRLLISGSPEEVFLSGGLDEAFSLTVRRVMTEDGWHYYCRGREGGQEE